MLHPNRNLRRCAIALAVLAVCVRLLRDRSGAGRPAPFPKVFYGDRAPPRVRREWRSLDADMRDRIVRAMWKMKTVPTSEGRRKYGRHYRSHDDIVLQVRGGRCRCRCRAGRRGSAL